MQEMDTNLQCDVTAYSGLPSARIYCLSLLYLENGIRKLCGTQAKYGLIRILTY
jgi:hypothetical protein